MSPLLNILFHAIYHTPFYTSFIHKNTPCITPNTRDISLANCCSYLLFHSSISIHIQSSVAWHNSNLISIHLQNLLPTPFVDVQMPCLSDFHEFIPSYFSFFLKFYIKNIHQTQDKMLF